MCEGIRVWLNNEISNTEDDGELINHDYFYPSDFENNMSELVEVKIFFKMFMKAVMQILTLQQSKKHIFNHWIWNRIMMTMMDVKKYRIFGKIWKLEVKSVLILKHPILLQSFLHNYLRIFILKHFQNIFTSPLISWNLWLVTYKKKKSYLS